MTMPAAGDRVRQKEHGGRIWSSAESTNVVIRSSCSIIQRLLAGDSTSDSFHNEWYIPAVVVHHGFRFCSIGAQEPPRTAGFAGRVSGALRMAMAKVERSRRGGEVDNSGVVTSEWDPELGQTYSKRREREGWEQGLPAGGGSRSSSCSESGSSSESSSSESGSSESSRSSSSDSDSDSAAHTVNGHALPRSGAPSTTRRQSTRSRNGEAERPPRVPKGDRRTGRRHVVNLRSSSSRRRLESLRHPRERRRSRAQTSSRRHYSRRRKVDAKRRSEAYSSTENSRVSQTATGHGLADLGRQAVASVVNIAFRAVLGSWNGVTTAAFKAIRTWQVRADGRRKSWWMDGFVCFITE